MTGLTALNLGKRCRDCLFYDKSIADGEGNYLCTKPTPIYVRPSFGCLDIDDGLSVPALIAAFDDVFYKEKSLVPA